MISRSGGGEASLLRGNSARPACEALQVLAGSVSIAQICQILCLQFLVDMCTPQEKQLPASRLGSYNIT